MLTLRIVAFFIVATFSPRVLARIFGNDVCSSNQTHLVAVALTVLFATYQF